MTGLSLRGLTVERARRVVVEDVSFSAPAGRLTAVLGARGAGKTTLLAAAAGLLRLSRGTVMLGGADVTRVRSARRGISLLRPGEALDSASSVARALRALAPGGGAERAGGVLDALGLAGLAARRVAVLTHGEHFAALAAARLLPPGQVLLVDEAGAGLDRGRPGAVAGRPGRAGARRAYRGVGHAGRGVGAGGGITWCCCRKGAFCRQARQPPVTRSRARPRPRC